MPLQQAVKSFISNQDTMLVGGFGQCIPIAVAATAQSLVQKLNQ